MKRNKPKRLLSMLLTLCMVLTLVPMTAFAANGPADEVTINSVGLNNSYPYLIGGAHNTTGTLNGTTCTAYLDVATGTLSLWNYNGNAVSAGGAGGAKDLTVKLKGTNTITGDLRNGTDGGNLIITAVDAASLSIVNSASSAGSLAGIATYISGVNDGGGSISITGKANITISVTNTSTDGFAESDGLFAKQGISISDSASLAITSTCHSSSLSTKAHGIYTENLTFTANTSGDIMVDVSSPQNVKPNAIRANGYTLTNVGKLTCKYNSTGFDFHSGFTPPTTFAYNKGLVSDTPTTEIRGGSTPVRTATIINGENNFGKSTGQYFSGDSVVLSANTISIPFSSWQSSKGSFSSATSQNTTFTMPNEDVTITARYNAFNVQPSFTRTGTGQGTISFTLKAMVDDLILVTSTGTEVVGGNHFNGSELFRSTSITDGTGDYDEPAGDYRVAAKIGGTLHFSDVFTVAYSETYAVTVTDGTGGGNFAEGATVIINANAPASGKVFDKWTTVDGVSFEDSGEGSTRFSMPAKAVAVTATYRDASTTPYAVTVSNGTGSGNFTEGATINITAGAPAVGKVFDKWTTSDGVTFADANSATTTFTMPAKAVTVLATYKDAPIYNAFNVQPSFTSTASDRGTVSFTLNALPEDNPILVTSTGTDVVGGTYFYGTELYRSELIYDGTGPFKVPAGDYRVAAIIGGVLHFSNVFTVDYDASVTTYAVTVNSGTGGGNFAEGATVNVTANAPAVGKVFDKWTTSDGVTFANANNATTTFAMPAKAVTVTATYKDAPVTTYAVTVSSGTGGGNYAAGDTVIINANAPASGKVFDKWTTADGVSFENSEEGSTRFLMPAKAVTVLATYKDASVTTYAVTVTDGTGGGNFAEGATVIINANTPAVGKVFDKWTTADGVTFADANSVTTTFTMPAKAVTVLATYKDASVTTYAVTVSSGTGGGNFAEGATVNVTANAPAVGKVFDKWTTSDGVTFADANSATTTFTMLAKAVTVLATYKDASVTTYAVTVSSGTGGGNFAEGATINITAGTPATGKVFDKWTTADGVTFANVNSATTTFTMPAKAVTVLATYKDAPVTTYAVTLSGGGSGATGAGSYAKHATININAGSRTSYIFTGWTSSDVTITNASNTNASFTMPEKAVTVTANWSYSGGGSSSGGSSSIIQPTVPAANGSIQVNYTASGGTAVLTLSDSKVDEIIARSKDGEVDIDLSKMGGVTSAEFPKTAVTAINEAGLDVTVKLPAGSITLKEDATVSIVGQAEGGSLKLELKQVAKGSLTDEQKKAVKSNNLVLDINISSGTKRISSFEGTLSITVPYSGSQPVAVWYLNDKGELEKLSCTFVDGTVSFNLDHLSLYVVGQDTAWVNPFADVKETDWFYGAVSYINEAGLMTGTSNATFSPYTNTTRGMIVTMLHRLEGTPKSDTANAFTDVGADKYYTDAVAWASDNTIVSGYGNGMFGSEDSITREQMAVILMNYAKYKGYDISMKADLSKFADEESISPWAKDAMSWANAEGLIQGSGSQLMPADNALRCQVAAILQRFIETIAK